MTKQLDADCQKTLDLLARERALLKAGDFHKLADLVKAKSQILEHLKSSSIDDPKDWKVVHQTLRRNQNMIQASLDGFHQAAQKLKDFGQVQDCLTTYNPKGRLQTVSTELGRNLEKKA